MNRPVRKVAIACMIMFAALLVNANWIQVGQAGKLERNAANEERRVEKQLERERGQILAGDEVIALSCKRTGGASQTPSLGSESGSTSEPGSRSGSAPDACANLGLPAAGPPPDGPADSRQFLRLYPAKEPFADITGYWGGTSVASVGLELGEDPFLSGDDDRLLASRVTGLFEGEKIRGGSVQTTIVPQLQRVAYEQLTSIGARGSVVALDPRTGAVLAMVTTPSYDPTPLASRTGSVALDAFTALKDNPDQPLLNRATQQTYPPGSTFKVVTAAAALSAGVASGPDALVYAPRELAFNDTNVTLPNFRDQECRVVAGEQTTLLLALQTSCNTAFGALGLELGSDRLREQAEKFGINAPLDDFPLPAARSVFPSDIAGQAQTAQSAVGQRDVRVTPLQMAEVSAAIANNGVRMQPYLVEALLGPDGDQIERTRPSRLGQAVSPRAAGQVAEMMRAVVEQGTGTAAQIPGVAVAGKTGTAEFGDPVQGAHAWFVGFAPVGNPTVAVAVVVEEGGPGRGTGGKTAAPIAKAVIEAALGAPR